VETATQTLHRLTSIDRAFADSAQREWTAPVDDPRVVQGFEANDLDRFPWFYKRYGQSLQRLALPRNLPSTTAPAVAVLAGTADVARTGLDLPQLSRLLHLSAGVVRTTERPYATWLFRAAGSAGGRFPLEIYVAVPEGMGMPAGVHWYDPQDHALVQIGPPPRGDTPTLVVTGVPWRTGWRYRERGYRHVYWDAGTMLGQLLAVAGSAGLSASLYSRYPDTSVAALVGADGVHEWPVAVVALGDGPPMIEAAGPASAGDVDRAPLEFPLVTAAQHAGDRDSLGPPWERGAPVDVPVLGQDPIETVVLARGSQRRMDPTLAPRRRRGHGKAAPAGLQRRRERLGDDLRRQRRARAVGRAAGWSAVHVRRRSGVRVLGGWPAGRTDCRSHDGTTVVTSRWKERTPNGRTVTTAARSPSRLRRALGGRIETRSRRVSSSGCMASDRRSPARRRGLVPRRRGRRIRHT